MFTVKTLNKISPVGLACLDEKAYLCSDTADAPDAVLVRSAAMHDMQFPASLKAIGRAGAGVNNIPVDRCAAEGIVVFNTPGANANAVKELVIAGLLLASRKIGASMQWVKTLKGQGAEVGKLVEKGKGQFVGPEIFGKTLGVVGLGAIGAMVANAAAALGMKVLGYDPYLNDKMKERLGDGVACVGELTEIYRQSDYITVHVPLTASTRGMLNSESIALMKDGARVLNFSRGELAVNADILAALASGKLACYVIDFPADELIDVENVVALPHLGASTPESEDNCAVMAAKQIADYLENGNIVNSVNFPAVKLDRVAGTKRIGVLYKNVPALPGQIAKLILDKGIDVENIANKSNDDYSYTLANLKAEDVSALCEQIQSLPGVLRVLCF